MQSLLKHTYLMESDKVEKDLQRLWKRYQIILKKPNWKDLNEARAILFFIGHMYCEQIAPQAIKRRLHLLENPMNLNNFLKLVDGKETGLKKLRRDPLFVRLEKYYLSVRKFKNKFVGGKYYMDEEKFIKLYNKYNPDKKLKIGYKGEF